MRHSWLAKLGVICLDQLVGHRECVTYVGTTDFVSKAKLFAGTQAQTRKEIVEEPFLNICLNSFGMGVHDNNAKGWKHDGGMNVAGPM